MQLRELTCRPGGKFHQQYELGLGGSANGAEKSNVSTNPNGISNRGFGSCIPSRRTPRGGQWVNFSVASLGRAMDNASKCGLKVAAVAIGRGCATRNGKRQRAADKPLCAARNGSAVKLPTQSSPPRGIQRNDLDRDEEACSNGGDFRSLFSRCRLSAKA